MKKLLIAGIIISSLAFAKGNTNELNAQKDNTNTVQTQNTTQGNGNDLQNSKLTEAQQKDLLALQDAHQKAMEPLKLAVQEKEIVIGKELSAKEPNWTKVETIVQEKSVIGNQMEMLMLKNIVELQNKFGISFNNGVNEVPTTKEELAK